jgi:hypothetical protein
MDPDKRAICTFMGVPLGRIARQIEVFADHRQQPWLNSEAGLGSFAQAFRLLACRRDACTTDCAA